ncbi:MAG: U32 family peptidase [Acidiferrobacteraceae bacterium]
MGRLIASGNDRRPIPMKLALGPLLYLWKRTEIVEFYQQIAGTPVDIVYLGETVCAKRRPMSAAEWSEIADLLTAAGKQVVLSTLALIEAKSDLAAIRRATSNSRYPVEANDMAAVQMRPEGKPFVAGPHLNIYNRRALGVIQRAGAMRWVAPLELTSSDLKAILEGRPEDLEVEIFAYGRMPLAFSARCFTARAHHCPKDHCETVCDQYSEGLLISAQDGVPFLVLNGVQVQSARVCSLLPELDALRSLGVDVLRLSPQGHHMPEIIQIFRDAIDGAITGDVAYDALLRYAPSDLCNGYFRGGAGMEQRL